jgi:putative aldouronate transport system substrate-binding protein
MRKDRLSIVLCTLLVLGLASPAFGSGTEEDASAGAAAPVELSYYFFGDPKPGQDEVFALANELIGREINATVEFLPVSPGSYQEKMNIITRGGDEFDLAWTSWWNYSYLDNANEGAFVALDDMLGDVPELQDLFSDEAWDAMRVSSPEGRRIYAVNNLELMFRQEGISLRKDLVDTYQFDISSVRTIDDLEPFLEAVSENEPDVVPFGFVGGYDWLEIPNAGYAWVVPGFVAVHEDDPQTLVDWNAEPRLNQQRVFDWYERGFYPEDLVTLQDLEPGKKAGRYAAFPASYSPTVDAKNLTAYGYETVSIPLCEPYIDNTGALGTMTAVSSTSPNPMRALEYLELVNTNADLYNLLVNGIDGVHYEKVSANRIEFLDRDSYSQLPWVMGNTFLGYLAGSATEQQLTEQMQLNRSATKLPTFGFNFDRGPVETELAAIQSIGDEWGGVTKTITDPDELYPEYHRRLMRAGLPAIIEEAQRQWDEFLASR